MATSTLDGLLGFVRPAQYFLQGYYGLDSESAADVVQDVLLRLFRTGPDRVDYPKRYLFQACRWRALQILRWRRRRDKAYAVVEKRRKEAEKKNNVVLIALDDEDKPKFFGQATPKQQEVLELMLEGKTMTQVSAILEIPESTVRMRVHLLRKRLGGAA
ncbi:MAG TPA: sigma-70 family RNA polymerase sigma factor [Planctomycetota bacterium]|nr:sigma-70 family RNA polymerase sigma factor [Planctomycetota bacterium]